MPGLVLGGFPRGIRGDNKGVIMERVPMAFMETEEGPLLSVGAIVSISPTGDSERYTVEAANGKSYTVSRRVLRLARILRK